MASIRIRISLVSVLVVLAAFANAQPLTQRCNWSDALHPAQPPTASVNVISSPVVLNLNVPGGFAQIAFVSYDTAAQLSGNTGGVLRVVDYSCNEIAHFPNSSCPGPSFDLSPVSGLAAGDLDRDGTAELVGVVASGPGQNRQLAAFNLNGQCLTVRWTSANTLPTGDSIARLIPAIAQMDRAPVPNWQNAEVLIGNKIYDANGALRFNGFSVAQANCGNAPCPSSRTVIAANVGNAQLPQMITGRGIYRATSAPMWGFQPQALIASSITNSELVYPAIAELDPAHLGPEIIVTDTLAKTLNVLRASGGLITSTSISTTACGGPPMIADFDGNGTADIGVATCTAYRAYRYNAGTLTQMWATPIFEPSGQTTSTFYLGTNGVRRIVYNDAANLRVIDAANGNVIQTIPNSSATALEGPVIASLDTGNTTNTCIFGLGQVIVAANGTQHGVRVFDATDVGEVASCWNEHSFHITNIGGAFGAIPWNEAPSWLATSPARNTYRVQRRP